MIKKKLFLGLALFSVMLESCKKDDEEPKPTTGYVQGTVTDADNATAIEGVRVIILNSDTNEPVTSLITNAEGNYSAELEQGSYYTRLYAQGYQQVPPKGVSPLPFTISVSQTLEKPIEMNPISTTGNGWITGKVTSNGTAVSGALVVASVNDEAYSTITDNEGIYHLYNVPANTYSLNAWIAGLQGNGTSAIVPSNLEAQFDLNLDSQASGEVFGAITFLSTNAVNVDVSLTHPLTGEAIPGLITETSANYSISNVPNGTYIARATYQNDGRVVDPDWIVKNGEPVVSVNNNSVELKFSLTDALIVVSPTNEASTTEPFIVGNAVPTFEWEPYPSASDYVIEVSDASGNVIWGGFDNSGNFPVKKVFLNKDNPNMITDATSGNKSVVFNFDNTATEALQPGKIYRWKVYVSKDDAKEATGWKLVSASEDQRGIIQIPE